MSKLYKVNHEELAQRWNVSQQASIPETKISECLKKQEPEITEERIANTISAYLADGVLEITNQPETHVNNTQGTQNGGKDS